MCLIERHRINWQLVVSQIRTSGRGQTFGQMARVTGISKQALYLLSKGGQPLHANGEALIGYWCDRMGLRRDCLPKSSSAFDETALSDDHSQVA